MSKVIKSSSGSTSGGNKVNLSSNSGSGGGKQLPSMSTKTIKSSGGTSTGAKVDKAGTNRLTSGVIKNESKFTLDNNTSGIANKTRQIGKNIIGKTTYNAGTDKEQSIYTIQRDSDYITSDFYGRINNYLNSGNQNVADSRAFRNEAVIQMNQAFDPNEKAWWNAVINYLDGTVYNYYRDKIDRVNASAEGYNKNLQNATNEYRSTQDLLGYQTDSNSAEYKNLFGKNQTAASKMKTAQSQVDRANAMKTQLEDELSAYSMDRDTWEARQRLRDMNLSRDNYREIVMAEHPEFVASPDAVEEAIDQLQKADQARIDAHMNSLGAETRLYNNRDKITESIGRFSANRITEIAGAASTVAKAMDEHVTVNGDPILGLSGPPEKKTKLGEAVELIDDVAKKSSLYAGDAYRKITRDMSKLGKGAFDLADQTAEMAWDIGAGYLLGVDPKFIMGERVFGSEGTKASMEGATGSQAFKYAITKAGIEYASESLFGAFDKFTRGKGLQVTQDMTERIIKALADTPAGRTTLRVFLNGGEEQLEEFFSAMLAPLADKIYKDESFSELFQNNMEDIGYSMLMAGILGSLGGAANVAENRRANMELYQNEFDTDISARKDILNEANQTINAPLTSVKGIMDSGKSVRQGAEENAQAKLAEQEKKDSSITKAVRKYRNGEALTRADASMLFAAGLINSEQRSAIINSGARSRLSQTNGGSKAGLSVDEKGRIQIGKSKSSGANRFEKLREGELERAEALGIGEKVEYNEEGYPESDNEARAKDREIAATGGITEEEAEEDRILSGADDANAPRRATGVQEASEDIPEDTGPAPKKEKSYEDSKKERETQIEEIMGKLDSNGELEVDSRENSRDPEFQRFNKDENKGKRVITRNTLEKMKSATREQPIFFYSDAFDTRDGQMPPRAAMYDGNTLYMVRKGNDGKMYLATVNNNALRQATYIEGMITPYTAGKPARWYSTMNGYGGIADTYARSILEQHGVDLSMVNTSESAIEGAEAQGASEGISVPPRGTETVKPGTTPTQEGVQTNGQETTATAGPTASPTAGEGAVDNPQTSDMGRSQESQRTVRVFERGAKGPNYEATPRYATRAPEFTGLNSARLTEAWEESAEILEDDWGGTVLEPEEIAKAATKTQLNLKDFVEERFGIPVTLYKGGAETPLGFTNKAFQNIGLFIDIDSPHFAGTVLHELTHYMWGKFGGNISRRQTVLNALIDTKVDKTDVAKMVNSVLETWGASYVAPRYGLDQQSWLALTDNERLNRLKMLPNYDDVVELMYEELGNLLVTFDERLSEFDSLFKACTVYQKALVANNVYTETEMREALEAVNKFHSDEYDQKYGLSQQVGEEESFEGADSRLKDGRTSTQAVRDKISDKSQFFLRDEKAANPHTPGKTKPMKSAQSGLETRGERQTRKENAAPGAETFTSRTNEARSETARLLTDTQEKANAQYRRLMEDGYTFNDDDVVLAQKLLADMQNAIRDFQLKSGNKMSRAGFDQLTKQYNKLFDKHMAEKSRMGQGLQAEYVFSTAERIKQRAAIMFLGFSPDGRFAGKAPGYKNAKMYGIVSDLASRIETAENAGDSKALINLCRDISTIRGTQKMAGVLSWQAAKMETKLLNQIANHENGAQALAQLAYANANRISDDLSDLKAGEVVKSIRVMNMLSNVATIINNIGNNLVSGGIGIFSQNAVGQLAQKPFERMTGQKVLSKAASGGIANKAIRNAQVEALQYAALMQYYGAVEENGRLELNNRASFNPNANAFEQTMSMYRFLIGMGVEATDKMKAAGLTKAMQMGIDADFAAGKIDATTKAKMESEAAHEVNKLLYKDDNKTTALVQHVKDWLNSLFTVGNEQTGTVGLGDITMAFAKIPANVVKARLAMTPEGALYYTAKYINGLAKAKTMHEQTVARSISEAVDENGNSISDDAKWARARQECSPRVWGQLNKLRTASGGTMNFDSACAKLGYSTAEEMTHFEMATVSRNLGKAATSVGMVALGAALRAIGAIRDFDQEPDEDKKKLLRQKGYTGLMFNVSAIGRPNHEWEDGDTVIGADWLETVAMPLAIGASAAEAAIDGGNVADTLAGKSLMKAIAAVGDIPGMQDAMNFYDSFNNSYVNSEKDTLAKIGDTAVTYLANQLPAFVVPNLFSQASAGIDNTVRNTYAADTTFGKAKNILLNKTGPIAGNVFGLREKIPASVDMWGEERTYGENWVMGLVNKVVLPGDVRKYHVNKYEKELYRLSNEGYGSVLPKSSVSTSFDVDGQTFKLTSAEQEIWRRDRAAIQRVDIERFLDSETYKELDDRQRQAVLKQLAMDAERTAKKAYLDTKDTSAEVTFAKWETDLNLDEQIEYLGAREILKGVWDDNENIITDYAGMDDFITRYNGLTDTQKEIINNNCSYLDDLAEAKEHKINSEQWEQAHNIYRYWQDKISESKDDEYKSNLVNEVQMWNQMQRDVGLNDRQMDYLEKNMQLRYQGTPKADQYYEYINDAGLSREQATGLITDISKLDIMDGYSQVQDSQKYMSIATSNKLKTQKEKWAAFWAIVPSNASKSKVANMKNYESMGLSLEDALRKTGWSEIRWKELQPNGKWKYHTVSK